MVAPGLDLVDHRAGSSSSSSGALDTTPHHTTTHTHTGGVLGCVRATYPPTYLPACRTRQNAKPDDYWREEEISSSMANITGSFVFFAAAGFRTCGNEHSKNRGPESSRFRERGSLFAYLLACLLGGSRPWIRRNASSPSPVSHRCLPNQPTSQRDSTYIHDIQLNSTLL